MLTTIILSASFYSIDPQLENVTVDSTQPIAEIFIVKNNKEKSKESSGSSKHDKKIDPLGEFYERFRKFVTSDNGGGEEPGMKKAT